MIRSDDCGWQRISEELRLKELSHTNLREKNDIVTRPRKEPPLEGGFYHGYTFSFHLSSLPSAPLERMWGTAVKITVYLYDPGIITSSTNSKNCHRCMLSYPRHGCRHHRHYEMPAIWHNTGTHAEPLALVARYSSRTTAVVWAMPYRYVIPCWRIQVVGVMNTNHKPVRLHHASRGREAPTIHQHSLK